MQLHQFLPYQLSVLSNKVSHGIARFYREQHGISIPEWRVLAILSTLKKLSAKELAYHSQMDKVKISRTMKVLEEKGLILERKCQQDARARRYNLTINGRQLIKEIQPKALAFEKQLINTLTNTEFNSLQLIIKKLNQQVDRITIEN